MVFLRSSTPLGAKEIVMKKILITLAAASTVMAAALPVAAQPYGDYGRGDGRYEAPRRADVGPNRAERLERRIAIAVRSGGMTEGAANYIYNELRKTERLARRYGRDGVFTRSERAAIDARYDQLERRVARDLPRYGAGYGNRR
jgi:hypothetical protein